MSDIKKYYYLKLKDNFFDSEEIKILENLPSGIYYSNLLIKLYLKSLKFNGALKFNDFIPYDENMIATITNLNIDTVRSGLNILSSMKLIERLDDGTIYMMNIQSFIGKSNSEADRKRLYRERIEEEKKLLGKRKENHTGQMSDKCPIDSRTSLDKRPPEIERELELKLEVDNRDIDIIESKNIEDKIHSQSISLLKYFEETTSIIGRLNLAAIKLAVEQHGFENVREAIKVAIEKNKLTMIYISGILKNWAKEGYPKRGDISGTSSIIKNTGAGTNEFSGLKPKEPKSINEDERKQLEGELL